MQDLLRSYSYPRSSDLRLYDLMTDRKYVGRHESEDIIALIIKKYIFKRLKLKKFLPTFQDLPDKGNVITVMNRKALSREQAAEPIELPVSVSVLQNVLKQPAQQPPMI